MKKFSIILTALAMVIAGCNKENAIEQNPVDNQNEGTVVSFTATLPQFTDETKATVDNTAFAWADGDKISIPANNAAGYIVFETKSSYLGTFKATVPSGVSLVAGKAIYPASVSEGTYSTTFASVDAARAGFKMEADYKVGEESLVFEHKSSLIHLVYTNVPSFATKLSIQEDGVEIASIVPPSSPKYKEDFYVPVDPKGEKEYTFALMEGTRVLNQVSKTAELVAGKYYSTPQISLNCYLIFKNASVSSIGIQNRTLQNGTDDYGWVENYATVDLTTCQADATIKYYQVDNSHQSYVGQPLRVVMGGSETAGVLLYRNIFFDATSSSLKTAYRTYLQTSNKEIYWGKNVGANIKDNTYAPTSYTAMTKVTDVDNLWYYEWPASYYGYSMNVKMQNSSNTDWYVPEGDATWSLTLNRDYIYVLQ